MQLRLWFESANVLAARNGGELVNPEVHPPLFGDALTRKPRGAVDEDFPGGQ